MSSYDNAKLRGITNAYSEELADFFGVEKIKDIHTILFESMDDLKKAFREYLKERYEELGKVEAPPEPPVYLKGYNPGGPKWKEVWMAKWGSLDERGNIMTIEGFNRRLKHELAHVYIHSIVKKTRYDKDDYVPDWLNEGLCYFLANQKAEDPGIITIRKLKELNKTFDPDKFSVGSKMVILIVEKFGKEKLLELLSMPRNEQILAELKKMFSWLK